MKDEMDILREVGSICAAHGSIALSQILNKRVSLQLPSIDILSAEMVLNKINTGQVVISVSSRILSGLSGNIVIALSEESAFKLIDVSYEDNEHKRSGVLTEIGISLVKEIGAVIISSYLSALSMLLKMVIVPSIPTLVSGPLQEIVSMVIMPYSLEEYVLLIEATFDEPEQHIKGSFYLVVNHDAITSIQNGCKKLLESLEDTRE
jgi:chemotaxis protein CheC